MTTPRSQAPVTASTGPLRARLAALALVCAAALALPLAQPLLHRRVFVYNDLTWFHLPTRFLYQEALRAGDSLLWTPSIFSGFYQHGEGQTGIFHPLHLLLYGALPISVLLLGQMVIWQVTPAFHALISLMNSLGAVGE